MILNQGVLIIPLRHPVLLAKMLATTDHLSGRRLALGAGLGWMEEEFAALHLPPEFFRRRGAVTNEYLRAIKELWTSTGPSSFQGEFVRFEGVGAYPKPLRKPHPPIYVLDEGLRAHSRLASTARVWSSRPARSQVSEAVAHAREGFGAAKRDFAAIAALGKAGVTHCLLDPVPDRTQPPSSRALAGLRALARG